MDCNKEEANMAKEVAEKKFAEKDLVGAKNIALKAEKLYPELDGLPQLLATLDVHISAGKRINGIVDWYGVLGVEPSADDDTIKKHYKKLALVLHPDKNKSVGAEGAFKILSEAWSLLSDKNKRITYDQKRNDRYAEIPNWKPPPPVPTGANGSHSSSNSNNLNVRDQRSTNFAKFPPPHFRPKVDTFWTTCKKCRMHFEYSIIYLNHNLICTTCRVSFKAIATKAPVLSSDSSPTPWASQDTMDGDLCASGRKPDPATNARTASCSSVDLKKNHKSGAFSKPGSSRSAAAPSSSAAGGIQPSCAQLKRRRKETSTAFMVEEAFQVKTQDSGKGPGLSIGSCGGSNSAPKQDRPKKRRRKDEHRMNNNERVVENIISTGNGVGISSKQKPYSTRELSQLEIRNMLMDKAKKEIRKKLDERDMDTVLKTLRKSKSSGEEIKEKNKSTLNGAKSDANKYEESVDSKAWVQTENSPSANSDIEPSDAMSMSVPDPDFHDFDGDRTEKSFGHNQVWASYDDDDGMPRYYAMIKSVVSLKPFKVQINWLNSKSNNELAPLNWVGCGFPKTSGDFWRGKFEIKNNLNSFSHKVRGWTKGTRGAIQIYPRKGDVWAVYRNWSADWDEQTPDEVIHKYDMVEVLEDYNETGVIIVPLIKVPGFKTVFRRPLEQSKTKKIPREEIFRLSHQVPSYLLTGQEDHNAPKGCLELDPASTPLELLQVLTEAQVEEMETVGKTKEEYPLEVTKNTKDEELAVNQKTTKKVEAQTMMKKGKEIREEKKLLVYERRPKKQTV